MTDSSLIDPSSSKKITTPPSSVGRFFEAMRDAEILCNEKYKDISNRWEEDHTQRSLYTIISDLRKDQLISQLQADKLCDGEANELVIDGKYLLLEFIDRGGMGCVYKCLHLNLKKEVAIKIQIATNDLQNQVDSEQRFQREMELVSQMNSTNIVQAHDGGIHEGKRYFVMELVDGETFKSLSNSGNLIKLEDFVSHFIQVADGLAYAHRTGCIHRDIKPGNLILGHDGIVKILDFGLAVMRVFEQDPDETKIEVEDLTAKEHVMGTYNFMPFEQMIDPRNATPKVDVYALACTMYCMAAHEPPFLRSSVPGTIAAHKSDPPPSLKKTRSDIPDRLQTLYLSMMSKDFEQRPTMQVVVEKLKEIRDEVSRSALEVTAEIPISEFLKDIPVKKNKNVVYGILVFAVLIAVFSAAAWLPDKWSSAGDDHVKTPQGVIGDVDSGTIQANSQRLQKPVDLLALVQFPEDVVRGKGWVLNDGILTTGTGNPTDIKIGTMPPEEYELEIVVERIDPKGPFVIGIVAGEQGGYLLVDALRQNGVHKSGLGTIGPSADLVEENDYFSLPENEKATLIVQVTKSSVKLSQGDEVIVEWTGGFDQVRRAANWGRVDADHLFIGTNNGCRFRVHKMELRSLRAS